MKKIIILTSTELRHKYFRVFLSQQKGIQVLKTFSEDGWTLKKQLEAKKNYLKEEHLNFRNKSEISLYSHDRPKIFTAKIALVFFVIALFKLFIDIFKLSLSISTKTSFKPIWINGE